MANIKDNLSAYGRAFIGFDEPSGNAMDSIGGYTGTLVNNPTRVTGWNGKGNAMSFKSSSSNRIMFNNSILPSGNRSYRFKIKVEQKPSVVRIIFTTGSLSASHHGDQISMRTNGSIAWHSCRAISASFNFVLESTLDICDNLWHDILFELNDGIVSLYIDGNLDSTTTSVNTTGIYKHSYNLNFGSGYANAEGTTFDWHFNGQLDQVEIYDGVISPIPDKYLVYHMSQYKYYDGTSWKVTTNTEENFIKNGMDNLDHVKEAQWKEISGDKSLVMWTDFKDKQYISIETNTTPYSIYDYISETPEVLVYTEATDDIIVSTNTESFDIYDEFGDSVEVLYYTDDKAVTNAELILEANWSPIDELEGDFEVVTWTDEAPATAQRVLEMTAVPKPQFIKLVNPKSVYGALDDVIVNDISKSYRDEARYFVAGEDASKWYIWDNSTQKFIVSDTSSEEAILKNGMKYRDLNNITDRQWRTWDNKYLNIGMFLKDNPRDTVVSMVESVSYKDYLPRNSTIIKDTSFYIINTTAKIDIELNGNILKGILSDSDLTRVQYRVLLNGGYYYPTDGSFTKLGESPQNIELIIGSKDIKIDDWNTLKVEFQDFFGTTDYWQTSFIGTYSGLMFKNIHGEYYSSEIGEVLKYLDFGVIIAGQTTIEYEVILKNQYGYDVNNIHLFANVSNSPTGMDIEFSESLTPFIPNNELLLNKILKNNEEMSFFIRLKTTLGVTPNANGSFDIIVRADKA